MWYEEEIGFVKKEIIPKKSIWGQLFKSNEQEILKKICFFKTLWLYEILDN